MFEIIDTVLMQVPILNKWIVNKRIKWYNKLAQDRGRNTLMIFADNTSDVLYVQYRGHVQVIRMKTKQKKLSLIVKRIFKPGKAEQAYSDFLYFQTAAIQNITNLITKKNAKQNTKDS